MVDTIDFNLAYARLHVWTKQKQGTYCNGCGIVFIFADESISGKCLLALHSWMVHLHTLFG